MVDKMSDDTSSSGSWATWLRQYSDPITCRLYFVGLVSYLSGFSTAVWVHDNHQGRISVGLWMICLQQVNDNCTNDGCFFYRSGNGGLNSVQVLACLGLVAVLAQVLLTFRIERYEEYKTSLNPARIVISLAVFTVTCVSTAMVVFFIRFTTSGLSSFRPARFYKRFATYELFNSTDRLKIHATLGYSFVLVGVANMFFIVAAILAILRLKLLLAARGPNVTATVTEMTAKPAPTMDQNKQRPSLEIDGSQERAAKSDFRYHKFA